MNDSSITTLDLHVAASAWAQSKIAELHAAEPDAARAVRDALQNGHRLAACVLVTGGEPVVELCLVTPEKTMRPIVSARADGPSETRN